MSSRAEYPVARALVRFPSGALLLHGLRLAPQEHVPAARAFDQRSAEDADDRSGAGFAGLWPVAWIGLADSAVHVIPGDAPADLRDAARHDHCHIGGNGRGRQSTIAGTRNPVDAAGGPRGPVLEALEGGRRRPP